MTLTNWLDLVLSIGILDPLSEEEKMMIVPGKFLEDDHSAILTKSHSYRKSHYLAVGVYLTLDDFGIRMALQKYD